MPEDFEIVSAGDATVLVRFAERIDRELNARAVSVADKVRQRAIAGVRDIVPTIRSVAISFDPLLTQYDELLRDLQELAGHVSANDVSASRTIDVPVRYGGEDGPDLAEVARLSELSQEHVIA